MTPLPLLRRTLLALAGAALLACPGAEVAGPAPEFDTSAVAQHDPGSTLPAGWREGPFAEIYVRGYRDSNGDGIGDLRGVTESLDYLQSLGVTGLWLMPINASQDHDHGYATVDYRGVEAQYGSIADLDELVAQAHARGIGVIIDYVMNHSAAQHPGFVSAYARADSPYADWYVFQPSHPAGWNIYGNDPWYPANGGRSYFAGFWSQMPDWNLRNPDVLAFHHDSLRFWLNRGVDGFRFDAVGNLVENGPGAWEDQPENYTIMAGIRDLVAGYDRRFVVCEGPADPWGFDQACGSAFAFGHNYDLVGAAQGDAGAVGRVAHYFETAPAGMSTMISNHDSFSGQRLWDQVGGDLARYRLAAATYLLQPGTPFIYYGEEIGISAGQGLSGDWALRTPMSWTNDPLTAGFSTHVPWRALAANSTTHNVAAEANDASSLLSFYRALIALRHARPSLAHGAYLSASASGTVMSFQRTEGSERTLAVFNYGGAAASASVAGLPGGATLTPVYPAGGDPVTITGTSATLALGARSFAVYDVAAP